MYAKVLVGILKNDQAFIDACGLDGNGILKLWPSGDVNQKASRPYATYLRVSRTFEHNKSRRGVQNINVQIDFYATNINEAEAMEEAAMNALDHFAGLVEGAKVQSIRIQGGGSGFNEGQESRHRMSEYRMRLNP